MIETIKEAAEDCRDAGMEGTAQKLERALDAFRKSELTAGKILGSKGGNTPVKPGSRPRGRPRKDKESS
jgi:hypothetical protein